MVWLFSSKEKAGEVLVDLCQFMDYSKSWVNVNKLIHWNSALHYFSAMLRTGNKELLLDKDPVIEWRGSFFHLWFLPSFLSCEMKWEVRLRSPQVQNLSQLKFRSQPLCLKGFRVTTYWIQGWARVFLSLQLQFLKELIMWCIFKESCT